MIDPAKTYRTRDGRGVRIYAVDGQDEAVHGATKERDGWVVCSWEKNGSYHRDSENFLDLIEAKTKYVRWINMYPYGCVVSHPTRQSADRDQSPNRIACVKVEFEEGEGL